MDIPKEGPRPNHFTEMGETDPQNPSSASVFSRMSVKSGRMKASGKQSRRAGGNSALGSMVMSGEGRQSSTGIVEGLPVSMQGGVHFPEHLPVRRVQDSGAVLDDQGASAGDRGTCAGAGDTGGDAGAATTYARGGHLGTKMVGMPDALDSFAGSGPSGANHRALGGRSTTVPISDSGDVLATLDALAAKAGLDITLDAPITSSRSSVPSPVGLPAPGGVPGVAVGDSPAAPSPSFSSGMRCSGSPQRKGVGARAHISSSRLAEGGSRLLEAAGGGSLPSRDPRAPGAAGAGEVQGGPPRSARGPVSGPAAVSRPRTGPELAHTSPDSGCLGTSELQDHSPRRKRSDNRGKRLPKEISTQGFEFKPISRSSSESGTPTKKERDRGLSTTSSIHSNRPSLTTCYVNFDHFDLQIENGRAPSQIASWDQLLALAGDDKELSVRQAVEWYGWPAPTKFQAVAIPCIIQACRNTQDSRSYTLLQAASGLGKTSALVLGFLSAVKREIHSLQFIIASMEGVEEVEKYINALSCLCPVQAAYYMDEASTDVEADVESAQGAQVIVGHPARVCKVLKAAQERLSLECVEVLFIDDASSLIAGGHVQQVCEINQIVSLFARHALRYVVVSSFVEREAKPALRAMKSSLMSKKNMFDLSQQVGRIKKCVKHYSLQGETGGWVDKLIALRSMIYIPRAVIFCDDDKLFEVMRKRFLSARRTSVAAPAEDLSVAVIDSTSQSLKQRRDSLASFCKEQQDFLLTRSEPNIFQTSLPRVFWTVHFGVDSSNLSWYGCRLLCLDSTLRQKAGKSLHHDGVSILFSRPRDHENVPKLEKMFGIRFEALPFGDI